MVRSFIREGTCQYLDFNIAAAIANKIACAKRQRNQLADTYWAIRYLIRMFGALY